ncbi:MAG TPA: nuclear transport factor 2 family protein [Candidatus Acidoferrum sp.]|nr:nuclear transport factor 2 family protein [Candidatus Acidoferrum sp.]
MRIRQSLLAFVSAALIFLLLGPSAAAQTEIPMLRCDRLPVVILQVDKEDKRFLVDTAATSFLNANSFAGSRTKPVHIQSWNETTALKAGDVSIGKLALGSHVIQDVRLPSIDLSAISKACGGQLDGILGVDLLEQLGVTIDLERSVARLGVESDDSELSLIAAVEKTIGSCLAAFNSADLEKLVSCFDPEFVLSSPGGELHGRDQAANYFRQYFGMRPPARLQMNMSNQRGIGELVWGLYDYTMETPSAHTAGRGMMLCRKSNDRWYIVSMQESPSAAARIGKP